MTQTALRNIARSWRFAGLGLVGALALAVVGSTAVGEEGPLDVMRYDPVTNRIEPVASESLKVGHIYRHRSARLRRDVWSTWQANGTFGNAFGEGTTQLARQFDVRWSKEEAVAALLQTNPELAETIKRSAKPIRLRLQRDTTWRSLGGQEVMSIFDAETGRRWENHHGRYVPVVSLRGPVWTVHGGDYVPIRFAGSEGSIGSVK